MVQSTSTSGTHWTPTDGRLVRRLAREDTPPRVMGMKLGRPDGGVRAKASEEGKSPKPTNQSPYNRRK